VPKGFFRPCGLYKFFRLRAPLSVEKEGGALTWAKPDWVDSGWAWDLVAHALKYVDYSLEQFHHEMLGVCEFSFGGTTQQELKSMPFDDFTDLVDMTQKAREQSKSATDRG